MRNTLVLLNSVKTLTTTVAPFEVPTTNIVRNSKRYGLASSVLRKWLLEMLEPRYLGFSQTMVPLMTYTDTKDVTNQEVLVKSLSTFRVWFINYIGTGSRLQGVIPNAFWNRRKNCPQLFVDFFDWLDSRNDSILSMLPVIRFILSWLDLGKVYTIPKNPSLEPITAKFTGTDASLSNYDIRGALESLGLITAEIEAVFKAACSNFSFHESSAAGPNGHALWASHLDGQALDNDPNLLGILTRLAALMGIPQILEMCSNASLMVMDVTRTTTGNNALHSRLHCIFEKGIKSRIIAIGDYFSQCMLAPFMDTLKYCLSILKTDYTYNQEAGFNAVLAFTKEGKSCYSLDLSKATDRLPLILQERIIGILLGNTELASLWAQLLASRTFITPNGIKVKYEVGQPQGFKSSFHSLALTHHVIVRLASIKAGIENFVDYAILGDDIVLTDSRVVAEYIIIMDLLGVKISESKSLYPSNSISAAEFCKRIAINGNEVTGIPVHLLANTVLDPQYTLNLWEYLASRCICTGFELYEFFGLFLNDLDFERLGLLNVLPSSVTGLKHRVVLEDSPLYSTLKFESVFGFSLNDVENFYYYCLVSDQLARVDNIVKKASSFLSIALETSKLGFLDGTEVLGTGIPLTVAIQDKLSRKDSELNVMHPIQSAARTLGIKLIGILNAFSADIGNLPRLLKSGGLNALCVTLDALPQFQSSERSVYGNRRILDKALRMLEESVQDRSKSTRNFIGKVTGVSQLWSITVSLGSGLVISPQNSVIRGVTKSSRTRLLSLKSSSVSSVLRRK